MDDNCFRQPSAATASCIAWALILLLVLAGPCLGQENAEKASPQPIKITADQLVTENAKNMAEFIGNVRAEQGTTIITSDRLKIFYKSDENKNPSENISEAGQGAIEKIIATGRVEIHMDEKLATTDQAVYNADTEELVLTGPGSKVVSGKNSIVGEVITIYRKEDRMTVDSSEKEQVKAVFYTKEKQGLQ